MEDTWEISSVTFAAACQMVQEGMQLKSGIGTLSEKSVHAALKYCCEPYSDSREIKVGGYVADIVGEHGIIEIQSAGFGKLRGKLQAFLPLCPVTVVWPCAETLWLRSFDPGTGEVRPRRRSPKHQRPVDVFRELYSIRDLLSTPGFHLKVVSLEIEELRTLTKTRQRKGRWPGVTKVDRFPLSMYGQISVDTSADYGKFFTFTSTLPETFTSKEFAAATGLGWDISRIMLKTFVAMGLAEDRGKKGNSFLFGLLGPMEEKRTNAISLDAIYNTP